MPSPDSGKRGTELDKTADAYRKAAPYLEAVWQLIGGVGVGVLAGYGLDRWLGTLPWCMVGGSVLGMTAGFVGFFRSLSRLK